MLKTKLSVLLELMKFFQRDSRSITGSVGIKHRNFLILLLFFLLQTTVEFMEIWEQSFF